MSDIRPSENQDDKWPGFRAAGFFDDLPKLTEGFFAESELTEDEPTEGAQHIVAAIDRLTEQTRVANMIAFGQATGESYRAEIRKALGISHE